MKVYIHIGAGKTGSSAIQSFLNYNREKLVKEYSILYPNLNSSHFDRGIGQISHCPIFSNHSPSEMSDLINNVIDFSNKKNIKNIVLSCECLLHVPKNAEFLYKGVENNEKDNCVIIAYMRRQDHWLESAWKQWGVKSDKYENIEAYIKGKTITWLDDLNKWAEVFGKENIIVHPYEKEQLPSNGLISDFLQIIGVNYNEHRWIMPPKNNLNVNFGFNPDIIEIFRLNRGFYKNIHDHRLLNFFSEYLGDEFKKLPFEKYSLLSPNQRLEILQRYEPMNKLIASEYMQRIDGRLFLEPWPNPNEPWEPYNGLTIEKIVPIYSQIMFNMNNKYQRKFRDQRRIINKKVHTLLNMTLYHNATKRWIKKFSR